MSAGAAIELALVVERGGRRAFVLEQTSDSICGERADLRRVQSRPEEAPLSAARRALGTQVVEARREGSALIVRVEQDLADDTLEPAAALRAAQAGALDLSPAALAACEGTELSEALLRRSDWVAHGPAIRRMPVRTPTLPPATHTNLFVVGRERAVLVEPATPYDDELDRVVEWVGELEAQGIRLEAILATHHHVDHIGGARALSEALGLPIRGHELTLARLPRRARVGQAIAEGDAVQTQGATLRAIHTPGHAAGHLCFRDEVSGLILVGDMVAGVGTILVEPDDGDMTLYLESLERLGEAEASALLPAHGPALRPPGEVLGRYVSHRLAREAKVLDALRAHGAPARPSELVPRAYDDAPRAVWGLAALSTEAHLIKLERDGRAVRRYALWSPALR